MLQLVQAHLNVSSHLSIRVQITDVLQSVQAQAEVEQSSTPQQVR